MATIHTAKRQPKTLETVKRSASGGSVADSDDYGGIGAEEFERRIEAHNRQQHEAVIDQSAWSPKGKAGW